MCRDIRAKGLLYGRNSGVPTATIHRTAKGVAQGYRKKKSTQIG